jgi:hypothetical protein
MLFDHTATADTVSLAHSQPGSNVEVKLAIRCLILRLVYHVGQADISM